MVSRENAIFVGRRRSRKSLPGAKSVKETYVVTPIIRHFWLPSLWADEMSFFYRGFHKSAFLFITHGFCEKPFFCEKLSICLIL